MKYILHWKSGEDEIVEGPDIATAMNSAGIGYGAMPALDYWETWYPEYEESKCPKK